MTLRRITLATTLIPLLSMSAVAQQTGISSTLKFAGVNPPAPPSMKDCKSFTVLSIGRGSSQSGPIGIQVIDGVAALPLGANVTLKGPLQIDVCDGQVIISGDITPPTK